MRGTIVVATAALVAMAGCGGGGGAGPTVQERTLLATPALDGWVTSDGAVSNWTGGRIGDEDGVVNGRGVRTYLSFDLAALPAGAEVESATLRVSIVGQDGAPGDAAFGPGVVDHLDYGPTLDAADWLLLGLDLDVATLFADNAPGYRGADVTAQVRDDLANARPRSQFRLRFRNLASDADGVSDVLFTEDAENGNATGQVPQLVVRYTAP